MPKKAAAAGLEPKDYVAKALKSGELQMSCEDPDHPDNWPRNMFVWRSNLLGSSGKGHEYFLKHLLGTTHGVQGKDLGETGRKKPKEVAWHDDAPKGKLDLLVTLDFRMSTTCVYSDIVLPTATWYEKNDLNTSDMHPFIHPLTAAVDPVWECKSDWEIYKAIAKKFSEIAPEVLGVEKDVVLTPILHDTPGEIAQALDVKEWKKGEVEPIPGKTMPAVTVVERDYPNLYKRFTALGPLMSKLGNGGKGIAWNTEHEVDLLKRLNGAVTEEGPTKGLAKIDTDIDATEVILSRSRRRPTARSRSRRGRRCRRPPAASTPISRSRRRTRKSASATSSRSRARSSRRRPGRGWSRRRSATTPATPTCTN